ncbi:rod shape-determining protein MreD [Staphylococcus sp. 17KM0847]|uniref:rod shape-determining protein MreD n=1 Tax=Staphylococcus sp. 17KM0847 TaxID=2583989 RepID=UPI0015DD21A0|nr:rod shape-determining protein MreD [Staphylococcus sp. 17KM0847]QLK85978.1 rod shape-determining protein MreD [Staphylococcus sp. 17KM0847]
MKAVYYFIGALFCFYIDTLLTFISPLQVGHTRLFFIPHLSLLYPMFIAVYGSTSTALMLGTLLGILHDLYFGPIYGVYLFGYLLSILLADKFIKIFFRDHLMVYWMILGSLIFLELFVALIYTVFGLIEFHILSFFIFRVVPTLFLNALLLVFLYFLMKPRLKVKTTIDIK